MSHNITERDGIFTVRQPAWHGLGTVFDHYPTRKETQDLVLPWEPVSELLYRQVPDFDPDGMPCSRYEPVENAVLNVRSDDGGQLGVVSSTYQTVSNGELFDLAEALQGEGSDVMFETGGSLLGGAKVWLLLRLEEPITVGSSKAETGAVIPYYALQNAHDGKGSLRGQATVTRIVCDNTAQLADMDARHRGTEFVFSHTLNVRDRIEQAKEALAGWRQGIVDWSEQVQYLASLLVTKEQEELFLDHLIPVPQAGLVSERVLANVERNRGEVRTIMRSETAAGIERTAYGLVQAAVEWNQHVRKTRDAESLFRRAYLNPSNLTARADELAQLVVSS
jgi:phage/plasmid-like protein (TIGR03299 family)